MTAEPTMTSLWQKLHLGERRGIIVLDAPRSFEHHLAELGEVTVNRDLSSVWEADFLLAFVTSRERIAAIAEGLASPRSGDVAVWLAYPKASSKRHRCDFNRDSGWEPLGWAGFEVVSQVSIDEDWSALRFRRVGHIRSLTRDPSRALSEAGRARTRSTGGRQRK